MRERVQNGTGAALVLSLAVATVAMGCNATTEHTGLVVEVRAVGLVAGTDLDQVVATMGSAHATFPLATAAAGDKVAFPFRFGVAPQKSSSDTVTITVVGRLSGTDKVQTSSQVGFVKSETHLLILTLYAACKDRSPACAAGTRCVGDASDATKSSCQPNKDDASKLPVFTGGDGGSSGSGGGRTDAASGGMGGDSDGGSGGGAGGSGGGDVVDALPDTNGDGGSCNDGDKRACSCGLMAGGNQTCTGAHWGPCTISCGTSGLMGRCAAGTRTCDEAKAVWGECSIAPAASDSCAAGNDDNCNGQVNEGCRCVMGQSQTCDKSGLFGKCAAGTQTCDLTGKWSACSITPAAADTCVAGNDDNCNGQVNEGCPCVQGRTRPCSEGGLFGKCAGGTQTCNQSVWSACSITPASADTCVPDNDDTCNGLKNEACACVQGQTRTCAQGGLFGKCSAGTETCDGNGHWGACSITPAGKDGCSSGNDDNCNGHVNEGCACVLGQTRSCADAGAKGKCAGGTQSCDGSGAWGACSVTAASADTCSPGDDSTCNGVPNEGCSCLNGQTQLCLKDGIFGKCGNGTETCSGGKWGSCSIQPSSKDTCDPGNDDNCNGNVNEGCPCTNGQTRFCSEGGLVGKCKDGTEACSSGAWGACSITPSGGDTCQAGNDDNCNGAPNEGCTCVIDQQPRSCAADGAQGTCASGTEACVSPGHWGPCSIQAKSADTCTSLSNDDNCDGVASCQCVNGATQSCGACGNTQTCVGGRWSACATCCPIAVNDKWGGVALADDSTPWKIIWPPLDPTDPTSGPPRPHTETGQGGAVVMPRDSMIRRGPYSGGYAVSFSVAPDDAFTIHLDFEGDGPYPAFRRLTNGPLLLGGLKYGQSNTFGAFGSWNSSQPGGGSAKVTIYVKAASKEIGAMAGFSNIKSGFVQVSGFKPDSFNLVGSNLSEYEFGTTKVGRFSNIVGCAGLSDAQVAELYRQNQTY